MVLLIVLQGRPISLWGNKLEVWTQIVHMYIVSVFVLMFCFKTWVMYSNTSRGPMGPQPLYGFKDIWFDKLYVRANGRDKGN